jgi:hypothetical protein
MADDPKPPEPAPAPDADRLKAVEDQQASLSHKIDAILGILDTSSATPADDGKPGLSTAEEIRRQLEERDAAEAKRKADEAGSQRIADLEAKVSGMGEKVPESPVRKVERFMGWR